MIWLPSAITAVMTVQTLRRDFCRSYTFAEKPESSEVFVLFFSSCTILVISSDPRKTPTLLPVTCNFNVIRWDEIRLILKRTHLILRCRFNLCKHFRDLMARQREVNFTLGFRLLFNGRKANKTEHFTVAAQSRVRFVFHQMSVREYFKE